MSLHVFASFVTPYGTAANNRGETEGNLTTLQKLLWQGETHTTVSAEAIRFAVRRLLGEMVETGTNRTWSEDLRRNEWRSGQDVDQEFSKWTDRNYSGYVDDDLLGFMAASAAKEETEDTEDEMNEPSAKKAKPKKIKGGATTRRSPLEVTRAISLTPWAGDVTFSAASPMATPSAAKKGTENPVPYGAEIHATRYQYGIALTPERLRDKSRAAKAIEALCNLGTVAGNHGRFLFDFAPDSVVIRITEDPAPRILYCFDTNDDGKTVRTKALDERLALGDIREEELIRGGAITLGGKTRGVKQACEEAIQIINTRLRR